MNAWEQPQQQQEQPIIDPDDQRNDFGWQSQTEVDQSLLKPTATTTMFKIAVPVYQKAMVAVIIYDREGNPFLTPEGEPFYNIQEELVMVGTETKTIKLPGKELFNIDLTSSFLNDGEVDAIRSLISLYTDLQMDTLQGIDRRDDMYYVYGKAMGIVNSAKAREGKTARLQRTMISEGSTKQSIIEDYKKDVKKHSWLPGGGQPQQQ